MSVAEELLELEDKPNEIVDSGPFPHHFFDRVESVRKAPKWWHSKWLKTLATVWLPILTVCYFIVSRVVSHAVRDLEISVRQTVDAKLKPVTDKLDSVDNRLHELEGWKRGLEDKSLAEIHSKVESAEKQRKVLPQTQLAEYRKTILDLSPAAKEFWPTVAALINYQSLLNQMRGQAPDPTKLAKPCLATNLGANFNNTYIGMTLSDCIIDIDDNLFRNSTFKDSVIRYHGGRVFLAGVRFVNCRFVLDLKGQPATPAQTNLLLALLDSSDQTTIDVSN